MSIEERVHRYFSDLYVKINTLLEDIDNGKYYDFQKTQKYTDRVETACFFIMYYVAIIGVVLLVMPNLTFNVIAPDTLAVYMAKQLVLFTIPVAIYCGIQYLQVIMTIIVGLYKYKPERVEE